MGVYRVPNTHSGGIASQSPILAKANKPTRTPENAARLMQPTIEVMSIISDDSLATRLSWLKHFENHRRQGFLFYYAFATLTPAQLKQPTCIKFRNCPLRFVAVYIGDTTAIVSASTKQLVSWLNQDVSAKKREEK